MERLTDGVWVHRQVAEGFPTISAVVLTASRAFVVDTLMSPWDMEPVHAFLAEHAADRRLMVVNTHHHWDHVYGNAAFRGTDIVAQQACPRLIEAMVTRAAESVPLPPPEGVPLPAITFGDRLIVSDEDETVHLIHTPGHSEDSLVVFLARRRVLLGGDTVEWPLPNLGQRGGAGEWVKTLRQLKQLPADLIVPSHGAAMDKQLLDADERYLSGLMRAAAAARRDGVGRAGFDVPVAELLGDVELDDTYLEAHRANLAGAWDEA
jgi:glyoxylase-like metal-dependent hydrolase (beta-lactamase superfamily II)